MVYVWNLTSTLQRINVGAVNAVSALSFSADGALLAVACLNKAHTVKVYDWKSGILRGSMSAGEYKTLAMTFSLDPLLGGGFRLLEAGVGHFNIFDGKSSDFVASKKGMFGAPKFPNCLCAAAMPLPPAEGGNEFIIGLSNGSIGVLARGERKISNNATVGFTTCTALHVMLLKEATAEEGPQFKVIAAGNHGLIKILDSELGPLVEFDAYKSIPTLSFLGKVRGVKSVCVDRLKRKILFGTSGGEIGELDIGVTSIIFYCCFKCLISY